MATDPAYRGVGFGAAVLAAAVGFCAEQDAALLWAKARLPALAFYLRAGFAVHGQPWQHPQLGPHQLIHRPVRSAAGPSAQDRGDGGSAHR